MTLLKFRGSVVFAVVIVSAESCQREAGGIEKFESRRSKGGAQIGRRLEELIRR